MKEFTLPRTGQAPVRFSGERIAEAGGPLFAGREQNRWYELAVYEIEGGRYAVSMAFRTQWEGEVCRDRVEIVATPADVAALLEEHNPVPPGIGFPPGEHYAERQRRLEAALRDQYQAAVSALLADERFAAPVEDVETQARENRDLRRYRDLLRAVRTNLPLTRAEWCLIFDALNGVGSLALYDAQSDFWRLWPAEVEDAIRLNALDDKWRVEARSLLQKIHRFTPVELLAAQDAAEWFWDHCRQPTDALLAELGLPHQEDESP